MSAGTVALSERLHRGTQYLQRILNADGGLPATAPGNASGCWTTAEGIQAILATPWPDESVRECSRRMASFLLSSQLARTSRGAWPLVVGGRQGSTMATAQVVLALKTASPVLDQAVAVMAAQSRQAALDWLRDAQGIDGGWGVEPNGGPPGKSSRVVSTFLALRALSADGRTVDSSHSIRRGVDWLWTVYDGSAFRPALGADVAVCATVRAISAIRQCGALKERPDVVARAVDFIERRRPGGGLWPVDSEAYVPGSAPGQVVFNNNTTAELLEFFVECGCEWKRQLDLVEWFQLHQRDDGSWCLGANENLQSDVVCWPTNEALLALSAFLRVARFEPVVESKPRGRGMLLWMLASIAIIEALLLFGAPKYMVQSWNSLPSDYKVTFWWTAVVAVALNIAATGLLYFGRWCLRRWRS